LIVGSVKTNIGHLESAAGVAGLMKTALILQHGEIPPNLHFKKPNPHIPWDHIPIAIPTERAPLAAGQQRRIAGVSAFGVAGTNAHAVLEEPPRDEVRAGGEHAFWKTPAYLLTLSAKSEPALQQLIARYQGHLERHPDLDLNDVGYTAGAGRFHFPHRVAILADSIERMRERLEIARTGQPSAGVCWGEVSRPPNIGLLCSEFGTVDSRMGRQLYEMCSVFRAALDECDQLLQKKAGWSVRAVLYPDHGRHSLVQREHLYPVAFSLSYAVAELWRSWGCVPSVVLGQGAGEIVAACVAGMISVEHGMDLSVAWGSLVNPDQRAGSAAASFEQVVSRIVFCPPTTPVVSQVTSQRISDEMKSARYWVNAFEGRLNSFTGSRHEENLDRVLEIGSSSSSAEGRQAALAPGATLATLRHDLTDLETAFENLASLYVVGAPIDWPSFYKSLPCRRAVLPTYPFQRQRHWFEKKDPPRKETEQSAPDPIGNSLYEEEWRVQPGAVPPPQAAAGTGTWLVLADQRGIGGEVARRLQEAGNTCLILLPGQHYAEAEERTISLDPAAPADWDRLLAHLARLGVLPVKGIVQLWSIDSRSADPSLSELRDATRQECCGTLHLIQSLMRARVEVLPRLWLVTEGAAQLSGREVVRLAQCAPWGMMRVVANEHPELGCTRLDLDPEDDANHATRLLAELYRASDEKQVAFRGLSRFVSRLTRSREAAVSGRVPFTLRPDATYLITGGLGGLGRLLAGWMIDKGAKNIAVLGRHAAPPDTLAHFQALQKNGARVTIIQADASVPEELEAAVARINIAVPLRGVVHCAGVLDDGIFINQSWERFERVLRPKIDGAWNLHRATLNAPLDFFVLFSSASTVFGNPGQANYATANAFLDGLARFRRAQGMTGLSIDWGIWSGVGGVTVNQRDAAINAEGVGTISAEEGLDALERLLSQSAPQVVVMPIRWPEFLNRIGESRFVDDFRQGGAKNAESSPPFIDTLSRAPVRERRSLLLEHVRAQVDRVLRTNTSASRSSKQGFAEMGMDSLTAVELKNHLQASIGCKLPSTVAFECPTIDALVDYIAREHLASLFAVEGVDPGVPSPGGPPEPGGPGDQLSEDEVNRLMDEKLKTIETFLEK
jgi:acyl transferase domain-containing protein/acyl carrier protein